MRSERGRRWMDGHEMCASRRAPSYSVTTRGGSNTPTRTSDTLRLRLPVFRARAPQTCPNTGTGTGTRAGRGLRRRWGGKVCSSTSSSESRSGSSLPRLIRGYCRVEFRFNPRHSPRLAPFRSCLGSRHWIESWERIQSWQWARSGCRSGRQRWEGAKRGVP
jgi:hypothetical protein